MPRATALLPDLAPLRRHRSFRLLWFGQLVSQGGTQVRLVALPYQIYLLTGSSLHVGLIGLFQAIPLLALTLFGGVIADRVDRGRLLVATQTGLMITSLALAVVTQFGLTELWFLYAVTALAAGFSAIDQPSRGALVPTLVDREDLPAAIALNQMLYQSAAVVGPALGGVVIASYGVAAAYWLDTATFAASIAAAAAIRAPARAAVAHLPILQSLAEGVRYVAGHRLLLSSMSMDLAAMLLASPRALFPFYAEQVFKVGAQGLGLLYAAPGVGALIAVFTSGWVSRVRRPGAAVLLGVCAWGLAIAAFGLMTEQLFVLGLVLVALAEAADLVATVFRHTILQGVVREELRGRLTAINGMFVVGGPNLGQVRAGAVAALTSPQFAVVSGGLTCIAAAIGIALWAPELVRYDRTATTRDEVSPEPV